MALPWPAARRRGTCGRGSRPVTVRGAIESYDAQILCPGQNVIAPMHARAWWTFGWICATIQVGSTGPRCVRSTPTKRVG